MKRELLVIFFCLMGIPVSGISDPLTINVTSDGTNLATALGGGGGLTIQSVQITNGAATQFGTYTGFVSPPVQIGDGVVLSTGQAAQVTALYHSTGGFPTTDTGQPGTPEFDAYGDAHISNFQGSYDVAAMKVDFRLSSAQQVGFQFIFGSVEYPIYTSQYTDAFLAFLDGTGTANQIVTDASGNPVQVGDAFGSELTMADTNTAFSDPHGLVRLQTFTLQPLSAGDHSITFEVGDVNDHSLDSAAFISDLHAGPGVGGTTPLTPEPSTLALLGFGLLAGAAALPYLRQNTRSGSQIQR